MIIRLHKKGTSFKGAAAYLLHDADHAKSNDRVDWVHTKNLATQDPDAAWRIMAATAMSADRLKAEAGVKSTGRKSPSTVLHFSLSWDASEKNQLDREQMVAAAEGAIKALGAQDRQAMIIAHRDTEHPHIHVLLNRVSQTDGRLLSSSKEKRKVQAWALDYEKTRGHLLCVDRAVNADARARGIAVRTKNRAPHIVAAEKVARKAANDHQLHSERLRFEQRTQDAQLARKSAAMRKAQDDQRRALNDAYKKRVAGLKAQLRAETVRKSAAIQQANRPKWRSLIRRGASDKRIFESREKTVLGKIQNAFQMMKLAGRVRGDHPKDDPDHKLGAIFTYLTDASARKKAFENGQAARKRTLERHQEDQIRQSLAPIKAEIAAARSQARKDFLTDLKAQKARHAQEREADRAEWRARKTERTKEWKQLAVDAEKRRAIKAKQAEAANQNAKPKRARAERENPRPKRPRGAAKAKAPDQLRQAPPAKPTRETAPPVADQFKAQSTPEKAKEDPVASMRAKFEAARQDRAKGVDRDRGRDD